MKTQLRNDGGRYSGRSNWYDAIAQEHIARVEALEAQAEATRLAQVVGDAVTALPEAARRLAKAATLVQHHAVWPLSSGAFLVGSQSDSQAAHLVHRGPWTCDCAYATHTGNLCTHSFAAMMTVKMGATYHPDYRQAA